MTPNGTCGCGGIACQSIFLDWEGVRFLILKTLVKSGTEWWPFAVIAVSVLLSVMLLLNSGALLRLTSAPPRFRHRVAKGAFLLLFFAILLTDWPGFNGNPRWSIFWASHALLAGTITSVVLLGAGLLAFDVETESLRTARRLAVARSIFANVEFEFRQLLRNTQDRENPRPKEGEDAKRSIDIVLTGINRFDAEVRNAQLLSIALGGDEATRLAELLSRLSARSSLLTYSLTGGDTSFGEDGYFVLGSSYWQSISDIGGILELLRYAVGAPVDAKDTRRILGKSVTGRLSDIEVVRRWGTLREGVGTHVGWGSPPEERVVNLWFAVNDPTKFEWSELQKERSRFADLMAEGRVQNPHDIPRSSDMYPTGGLRHPSVLPIDLPVD